MSLDSISDKQKIELLGRAVAKQQEEIDYLNSRINAHVSILTKMEKIVTIHSKKLGFK
jgi:hypothetical protein